MQTITEITHLSCAVPPRSEAEADFSCFAGGLLRCATFFIRWIRNGKMLQANSRHDAGGFLRFAANLRNRSVNFLNHSASLILSFRKLPASFRKFAEPFGKLPESFRKLAEPFRNRSCVLPQTSCAIRETSCILPQSCFSLQNHSKMPRKGFLALFLTINPLYHGNIYSKRR